MMKQIRTCQESYDACQRHWKFMGFLHSVSDRNDLDRLGRILSARIASHHVITHQANSFKRKHGGPKNNHIIPVDVNQPTAGHEKQMLTQ